MSTKNPNPNYRDFDAEQREVEGEPLEFKLGGERFVTVWPIPVGSSMMVAMAMDQGELEQLQASGRVLSAMVPEEDRARFARACGKVTDMEVFQKLIAWIVEESTGRPTSEPASSSD